MAKTITKSTKPAKAAAKKTIRPKSPTPLNIEKLAEEVLEKMEPLGIDAKLQSEIQWCLGSYKNDQNPIGLLEKIAEALPLFKSEQAKKTKGITAKFIGDVEKALAG